MEIYDVTDDGLGHTSFVVGLDDATALVVDPARFPDQQRRIAAEHGWTIAWTADTHSHADYISGSRELADDGAEFLASKGALLEGEHRPVAAGETVALTDHVELHAIPTPGHTPDHLAYLLLVDGHARALFTGGSLMVGAVGRTDLLGDERREELARQLFHALQDQVLTLPDELAVYPTHGAGSFCSAPAGAARTTTIGVERATNPLLSIDDEDRFVAQLLDGLGSFPSYFRELPEVNRRGPRIYAELPQLDELDLATVRGHLQSGAVLVDARSIASFAAGHVPGSLSIEQRPQLASWLGWLVPLDQPVVFLLDRDNDREDLVRRCLTIGHEALLGEIGGGIDTWTGAGLPVETIALVGPDAMSATVLDVRQRDEWSSGHVPGAIHIELGTLRGHEPPPGPLTVLCGHGERAMTGASILEAAGHHDLSVLAGGPQHWAAATGGSLQAG